MFSWWTIIISLEFAIYQIAIADGSKVIARDFVRSSRADYIISPAFHISSELTNMIFGQRLISRRAFAWSFLLSTTVFIIAYLIAAATTRGWWSDLQEWFFKWPDLTNPSPAHEWELVSTLGLTLLWLAFEFIYVVKSRWFIRFITEDMQWYRTVIILITDICTTLLLLVAIAPLAVLLFGKVFLYAAGSVLNHNFIDIGRDFIDTYNPFNWHVYRDIAQDAARGMTAPFRGDFQYHILEIGTILDTSCRFQHNQKFNIMEMVQCHSPWMYEAHVTFPLTTMIVSAWATTVWMTVCATTLLAAKAWRVPRAVFLWVHDNPKKILTRGLVPTILIALVGGLLIPVFAC